MLTVILKAIYVDIWATRSVAGIQPEPLFYPLFQLLKQDEDSQVIIFDPNQLEKEIALDSGNQSR
ncbi:MAG TPA: hypothetical protein VMY79_02940 [Dehalococcoidia bacterium]|nr:hypothetical protein [Dehalococcoidia bacterium]